MLQNPRKTLGFKKNMVYKIPPGGGGGGGGGGKPYPASGLQLSLNAGQKYCRMLQGGHSAIRLNFIKLPLIIKIFVSV